jgi:hypothetical protein
MLQQAAAGPPCAALQSARVGGVKRQNMITQKITAIALRLLAIWLLIQLTLNLPTLIILFAGMEQYQQQEIPMSAYIGLIGVFVLIGLVVAFLINKAATSILAKAESDSEATLCADSQKLLFQLAGLYFVVNALVSLPRSLSFIPNTAEINASHWLWSGGLVFQLVIGVWLASNSTYWLNLFHKLRGRA